MALAAVNLGGTADVVLLVAILAIVYMAPTLIAAVRRTGHLPSILCINLLAGWTGAGWWVALSMMMVAAHQRDASDHANV